MEGIEVILDRGIALVLIMTRVAGIFLLSPLLSGSGVAPRFKTFLTLFLGFAAFATVPEGWSTPGDLTLVGVGIWGVRELMVGITIGFVASFPVTVAQLIGQIAGYQVGLSLAQAFNPATDANSGVLEALMFYLALGIFVTLGGLEALLVVIARTFESVPPGGLALSMVPAELIVGVLRSGFEVAMRASAPVVAIIMIETVASALIMRTIPAINILSVGFAIKTVVGVLMLVFSLAAVGAVIQGNIDESMEALLVWAGGAVSAVGGGAGSGVGDG